MRPLSSPLRNFLLVPFFIALLLTPVRAQTATPPASLPWPPRIQLKDDQNATGIIRTLDAPRGLSGARVGLRLRPQLNDQLDAAALLSQLPDEAEIEFESQGAFVYRIIAAAPRSNPAGSSPEYFVFISGERKTPEGPVRIQRTWFAYHPPAPTPDRADQSPRGTALLMPGMLGTPEPILDLFTRELNARGWAVLRMMCQPSRFTERIVFEIDLLNPLHSITAIAAEMNTRVAEAAYAAEAAMDHILAHHQHLAEKPRIALGMSGGAMILPTVLAREPGQYAAAIAIAGGANFFAMSDESNYKFLIGAVDFRWLPEPPNDEQRENTYQLYLQHAPLDAFNTAAAIVGMPLLMIHATFDAAVPSKLGDLLWERLGRPERWTHEAGHEELFMKLPAELDQIMDWLDKSVPLP
jgi:hypothetical protein